MKKKISFSMPSLKFGLGAFGQFGLPSFLKLKMPFPTGIYLGGGKLIMVSLSFVVLGFLASMFLLISKGEQEIVFPQLGASYQDGSLIGSRFIDPEQPEIASQTLQIYVKGGATRIDEINLKNISLGKPSLTDAFAIQGLSATDSIVIGEMIIKNSEFPSVDIATAEIYKLDASTNVFAAGHTFSVTSSTATNNVTVGSARGATNYTAEDMTVDRILITQNGDAGSGDVVIGKIILDNVNAYIGAFNIDNVEIGTMTWSDVRIGDDGNIDTADFVVNNSVNVNTLLDGVVEQPIEIR